MPYNCTADAHPNSMVISNSLRYICYTRPIFLHTNYTINFYGPLKIKYIYFVQKRKKTNLQTMQQNIIVFKAVQTEKIVSPPSQN